MKILVHICCSVDSHFFLQRLQVRYPNATLIGFFYDPNIHPYSEYYLRLLDVKRSCKMLDVELIEGEYDYLGWIEATRGLENEPEKGARCTVCFDKRFEVTAQKAKEIDATHFTSTLLTSPKKSINQLTKSGQLLASRFNIGFLAPDFRQKNGTQEQNIIAKEAKLYRQNYCGCLYALKQQREIQNRLLDELFSPINKQIQPASIEDRIAMYEERILLEESCTEYEIVKNRIINYRLLFGKVVHKKETISSHILPMSIIKNRYSRGKIEKVVDNIYYFSRDEIKFITLKKYNQLSKRDYKNILELINNPPSFKEELELRVKITDSHFDISTIVVLQDVPKGKYELFVDSKTYEDVQERIKLIE